LPSTLRRNASAHSSWLSTAFRLHITYDLLDDASSQPGAVLLIPNRWPLLRCLSRLFRLRSVRLLEQLIGLREFPFGLVIADQRVE